MNWPQNHGGGGAIDLVMHLANVDFRTALEWLEAIAGAGPLSLVDAPPIASFADPQAARSTSQHSRQSPVRKQTLGEPEPHTLKPVGPGPRLQEPRLPAREDRQLGRVLEYLTRFRHLSSELLKPLLDTGRLYADARGNAVFVLVRGKPNQAVGAELRGTGPRVWRGMAPGSRKDDGYFWVGEAGAADLVLCESAIDAISCFQLRGSCLCISTAGVRANPRWLSSLLARGYEVRCGFDTDEAGETAAHRMLSLYPQIRRLPHPPTTGTTHSPQHPQPPSPAALRQRVSPPEPKWVNLSERHRSARRISAFRGQWVLVDVWATWCGPCVAAIPEMARLHDEFAGRKDFVLIGLSLDQDRMTALDFVAKRKLPWLQGFLGDWSETSIPEQLSITLIPAYLLIDPDGRLHTRSTSIAELYKVLDKVLRANPRLPIP